MPKQLLKKKNQQVAENHPRPNDETDRPMRSVGPTPASESRRG